MAVRAGCRRCAEDGRQKGKIKMTKADLMKKFNELQYLNDCLTVVKMKYPNIYNTVVKNGDWKHHSFNRLYIYNTARLALA